MFFPNFGMGQVMDKGKCSHTWEMVNIVRGLIVMKKCFHCGKVSTCFTFHNNPPLEASHEESHFWNFVESDEAFHFDLKCTKCGTLVKLDELVGLMICTGCDQTCEVDILKRKVEPEKIRVCIALGCQPIEERKQLPPEKFAVLEDFFSQQFNSLKSLVVPYKRVKSIASCYADVIKDVDMLLQ